MSYKGIQDLYNDFNSAVSNVSGLNQFYMLDESEVNKLRNINYPVCISSIPNSLVSDTNRAYEEYQMTLLILKKDSKLSSDYVSLKLYDDCIDLFTKLTDEIMFQRGGRLIVDQDSLEVERVSRLGNDLATGVRLRFNLLAPSQIAFPPSELELSFTTGLRAFYTSFKGVDVTATASSVVWTPRQNPASFSNIVNLNTSKVPSFSNDLFVFSTPNNELDEEALKVGNISTSGANFTIIMSVYIEDAFLGDNATLFSFDDDTPATGDAYAIEIRSGGGNRGEVNILRRKAGLSIVSDTSSGLNLLGYGSSGSVKNIAIINDFSNNKTTIKTEDSEVDVSAVRSSAIDDMTLILGGRRISSLTQAMKGIIGELKNFVIYDGALTSSQVNSVFEELDNI